jgi:pyruvate formate lyase activating enzyme
VGSRTANTYTSLPGPSTASWQTVTAEVAAVPAVLARSEADRAVRCVACAHRCLVRPGRSGICNVRENRDGCLVSTVYGNAAVAVLEPIEKKPLFHAFPGTRTYSISMYGCNFHCRFCQNWELSQAVPEGLRLNTEALSPHAAVNAAIVSGARSIAYTFVEPTVYLEYVLDTARLAHEAGLANILVTNGYQTPEALDLLAPLIDAANVDLKSFTDWFYRKLCGARLAPVLDALRGMRARGMWIEVTTLIVPELNDDPDELRSLARWIRDELGPETPWHVSRFFPAYRMPDTRITPAASIRRAVWEGHAVGLHHVYAGNVGDVRDDETRCTACGRRLLQRRRFSTVTNDLVDGACPGCGARLAGIGLTGHRA